MISDPQLIYVLILLTTGAIVGFACGLLGIGGGFIMVPVQIWALTFAGIDETIAVRVAFGTSLAVILPTALSGCHGHSCRGAVLWRPGIVLGLFGLIGAFLGGTIAAHVPGEQLKIIFGLVVITGAFRMLLYRNLNSSESPKEALMNYVLLGFIVGVISGMSGIGGGVILVPALVVALGFSMHQAIGSSSLAIAFNSVGGILAYAINGLGVTGLPPYSIGYINLPQFILLAIPSILVAQLGVRTAHRLPSEKLRFIFIALMIYVGLRMIGFFSWIGLPI